MSKGFFGFDYHSLMAFAESKGISTEPVIFDLFEIAEKYEQQKKSDGKEQDGQVQQ